MRKRLYEIIEVAKSDDRLSSAYDIAMMITILISIIPLAFIGSYPIFDLVEKVTAVLFIIDYLLRLFTADYKLNRGAKSFVLYPFTPMAILDLISILPAISLIGGGWKLLKVFRLFRTFRVFRVLKVFRAIRYSKNIQVFVRVFQKEKDSLLSFFGIAIMYILISALVVLNVEPETFGNYFRAVYWATISLTTMGYGDIYPVTTAGQIVTMLSSFMGIAIIAMPAGVITAGFMEEIHHPQKDGSEDNSENKE